VKWGLILPDIAWMAVVLVSLRYHIQAWRRFDGDSAAARRLHALGEAPTELLDWSSNQVLRYSYRIVEGGIGIVVGLVSAFAVFQPGIRTNPIWTITVATFFFMLIGGSGFLSRRDSILHDRARHSRDQD